MHDNFRSSMEILFGISTITVFLHEAYPVLSFIAVLCGAILGIHGVYNLIRGRPNHHDIYSEGVDHKDHHHE